MTETTAPEKQYAHQVCPEPTSDTPEAEMPGMLARLHAARAYGFWAQVEEGTNLEAVTRALYEYRLAHVWWFLSEQHRTGLKVVTVAEIASDLVTDLEAPHVLGPNIHFILRELGVDPDSIRAYGDH